MWWVLKASRTLFFPDSKTISSAINKVKLWSQSFPNFNIQEHFGPMNMERRGIFQKKKYKLGIKNILQMQQDDFYLKKISNAFFDRWTFLREKNYNGKLRESKKLILSQLEENISLSNIKVLEVGCFVGDLLADLKKNYSCKVYGIEPS